jgi:glycosyltransferase involved in cell wall biosynthesis
MQTAAANGERPYRFGFVLTVSAGNNTRYQIFRRFADKVPGVVCEWAPIRHFLDPDPLRFLPGPLHVRAEVMYEARKIMTRLSDFDAVMFHAFEPYVAAVLGSFLKSSPLVVWSQDNPPSSDASVQYSGTRMNPEWRRRIRFQFDRWCAQRVGLFVPFSEWAGDIIQRECGVPAERVVPINVGLDLSGWPNQPLPPAGGRSQILFVGGNFERKGGDVLLEVYSRAFADTADLHLVTREPPPTLPPGVRAYTDLHSEHPKLRELYRMADVFVLPTRADLSPFVLMEAMATGRPVISSRTGGIPDIVGHGETGFLIEPAHAGQLEQRLREVLASHDLRAGMAQRARQKIEQKFDASKNVPLILETMKAAVERRRSAR